MNHIIGIGGDPISVLAVKSCPILSSPLLFCLIPFSPVKNCLVLAYSILCCAEQSFSVPSNPVQSLLTLSSAVQSDQNKLNLLRPAQHHLDSFYRLVLSEVFINTMLPLSLNVFYLYRNIGRIWRICSLMHHIIALGDDPVSLLNGRHWSRRRQYVLRSSFWHGPIFQRARMCYPFMWRRSHPFIFSMYICTMYRRANQ